MSTTTFADGTSLTSSALSQTQAENILQPLVTQWIGATDANGAVRISWPTAGAPAMGITEDVCFLRLTLDDANQVNRTRETAFQGSGVTGTVITTYLRIWRVDAILYGPNSFDHARQIKSCFFFPWVHTLLSQSNLAVVMDIPDPRRVPELANGQWWERSDFTFRLSELVTEITSVNSIQSVEIDLYTQKSTSPKIIDLTA